MPLTDRLVGSLPYGTGEEVADQGGLKLRVGKEKVWWWVGRDGGKVVRRRLGSYPAMSLVRARLAVAELKANREVAPSISSLTLDELLDKWVVHQQTRMAASTLHRMPHTLVNARRAFGPRKAAEITRGELVRYLEELGATKPAAANNLKTMLSGAFKYGVTRELVPISPLDGYSEAPGGAYTPCDRALTVEEVKALWPALGALARPADAGVILKLILTTAQRPGEVCGMLVD